MTRKRPPTRRATFTSVTPFRSGSVQAAHKRRPSEASSTSHTEGDRLSGAPTWTQEVPARLGRETVRTPASESDATYGVSPTTASATCGTLGVTASVVPPGAGSATRCQAASSACDAAGSASAARAIATSSLIRETGTALRIIPSLLCPHRAWLPYIRPAATVKKLAALQSGRSGRRSGAAMESNQPTGGLLRPAGFEVRGSWVRLGFFAGISRGPARVAL